LLFVAVAVAKLISSMVVDMDPCPVQSLQAPSAWVPPSAGEVEDIVLMKACVRDFQWLEALALLRVLVSFTTFHGLRPVFTVFDITSLHGL
jgi:hypothetical protein